MGRQKAVRRLGRRFAADYGFGKAFDDDNLIC
jgi:hypothetical protein